MEKGSSTVRYLRNLVKARAATLNWDRLTVGEGDAAIGRHSHTYTRTPVRAMQEVRPESFFITGIECLNPAQPQCPVTMRSKLPVGECLPGARPARYF